MSRTERFIPPRTEPGRTRLIFNADDFGMSPSINRSILKATEGGLLKSVSLMVTHSAAEDAVLAAAALPDPPAFGLHISLTSGRALSRPEKIPLLVDKTGCFKRGFLGLVLLLKSFWQKQAIEQILIEVRAQLREFDRLMKLAPICRIDHLDAHQHIQVLPKLLLPLMEEADRRKIVLRIPREPVGQLRRLTAGSPIFRAKGILKKMILDHFIRVNGREFFPSALIQPIGATKLEPGAVYFGILDSGRMNQKAILRIVKSIPKLVKKRENDIFEINLHPWRIDGETEMIPEFASRADRAFARSKQRQNEYRALTEFAPQIHETMNRQGIEVANFVYSKATVQDKEERV